MMRSVLAAPLIAILLLAVLELVLRAHGFATSSTDDINLWCQERDRVSTLGTEGVVLLGTSRMQHGFSLNDFRNRHPKRPICQLAINGSEPAGTLIDIAERTRFRGLVICEFPYSCSARMNDANQIGSIWPEYYHRDWNLNRRVNRRIVSSIQERFVVATPNFGLNGMMKAIVSGRLVSRSGSTADRQIRGDLSVHSASELSDMERRWIDSLHRERREYESRGREAWEGDARAVGGMARKIERRGGRVVFVRFPLSNDFGRESRTAFPKEKFWNPFLQLAGVRGIDAEGNPALNQFNCPDGSHLDFRDAPAFTNALCSELERLGVL